MVTTTTNDKNNTLSNEDLENVQGVIEEKTLYNPELKNDFLSDISEGSLRSYTRIFLITSDDEKALNKDVNQFTFNEIETILYKFKAKNRNTVESYARIISSYLNWAVLHGYITENVMTCLKPDDFDKYLSNGEIYFNDHDLDMFEGRCANYQDAIILRLAFIGVSGRQMSEMRNLKINDLNIKERKLTVINTLKEDENRIPTEFTERDIKNLDDRTIDLILKAYEEKTYKKKNGEMNAKDNVRSFTDLVENDYVLRASITQTTKFNAPVDKFVIYRRLVNMSIILKNTEKLTAKFIQRSGMLWYANEKIKERRELVQNNELTLNAIKMVADRFGIKSHHNLKGFLTYENVRKLYPE